MEVVDNMTELLAGGGMMIAEVFLSEESPPIETLP